MGKMTESQWREFVNAGTRTGKLATVRADGRPHVVPVWFLVDGDDVVFTTYGKSVKGQALQRDPRIALCVDEEQGAPAFALINAQAKISEDPDDLLEWSIRLAERYLGPEKAEDFARSVATPGALLVRARIESVAAEVL